MSYINKIRSMFEKLESTQIVDDSKVEKTLAENLKTIVDQSEYESLYELETMMNKCVNEYNDLHTDKVPAVILSDLDPDNEIVSLESIYDYIDRTYVNKKYVDLNQEKLHPEVSSIRAVSEEILESDNEDYDNNEFVDDDTECDEEDKVFDEVYEDDESEVESNVESDSSNLESDITDIESDSNLDSDEEISEVKEEQPFTSLPHTTSYVNTDDYAYVDYFTALPYNIVVDKKVFKGSITVGICKKYDANNYLINIYRSFKFKDLDGEKLGIRYYGTLLNGSTVDMISKADMSDLASDVYEYIKSELQSLESKVNLASVKFKSNKSIDSIVEDVLDDIVLGSTKVKSVNFVRNTFTSSPSYSKDNYTDKVNNLSVDSDGLLY